MVKKLICDKCAFKNTDCILKPRVIKAGGKTCELFSEGSPAKAKRSQSTWPTSEGNLVVKTCHPGKKPTIRIRKPKLKK